MDKKELLETFQENLKEDKGFINHNGYKLIDVQDKYCLMEALIDEKSLNAKGIAHGGFLFGLADTAGGIAAITNNRKVVTVNADINYLHPARSKKVIAEACCLKDGSRITVYEVKINDENNILFAKATLSYFYID